MFEHSIRVPRHYKVAANIFKKVSTEGGSVKTLLYDNKLRHFRTNVLFALITETVKHAADIDKIFEASEILKNESRLDPWLAKVLTAELLFGKKSLPGISKPEQTVLAYKEKFEKYANEHEAELKIEVVHRPRYVRINTNLLTTSDAIRSFQDEGYRFIRCTSGSYNDYLEQIRGLTEYDFTQDYHVKTVFVFPHSTKFHEHELYLENQIILQDKATAMAVHLLAPSPGSVVLDMCAAPGMKTTQAAAYMRNEGKVYAVERNEKRFQTLTDFVNKTGCKCVELIHKDVLEIRRGDYEDVEYILLDPSCSGSGMEFTVHNYIEDTRLAKLTSLQEKFLKHAMNAFPKAKRIIYSTCSLFPEENERVITNVVKNSRVKWRVQDVKELLKGQWNNFGSGMYGSMGTRCLYARPDSDSTTGFFLAVLDRDLADLEKNVNDEGQIIPNDINTKPSEDNIVKRKLKNNNESLKHTVSQADDNEENNIPKKKKKEKKFKGLSDNNLEAKRDISENADCSDFKTKNLDAYSTEVEVLSYDTEDTTSKKKNKKRKHSVEPESLKLNNEDTAQDHEIVKVKKKKHKQKYKDNETLSKDAEVNEDVYVNDEHNPVKKKKEKVVDEIKNVKDKKEKQKRKDHIIMDNQFNDTKTIEGIAYDEPKIEKKKKKKVKCHEGDKDSENSEENIVVDNCDLFNIEGQKNNIGYEKKKKKKKRDKKDL